MSRLPLTDGIYVGGNLIVAPMPPVPPTSAPWIQFDSNGLIIATDFSELRKATGVISKGENNATSLNISLPTATNINSLFQDNKSLEHLEFLCTSESLLSVTNFGQSAIKLKTVRVEIPNLIGIFGNFNYCSKLESAVIILPKCEAISSYLFANCSNLTSIQLIVPKARDFSYLCYNNRNLTSFSGEYPELASFTNSFRGTNLQQFDVVWPKISNLQDCFRDAALEADEINKILETLPSYASGTGAHVVTFTGCPGAATCDPSIGTAKGWTVQV